MTSPEQQQQQEKAELRRRMRAVRAAIGEDERFHRSVGLSSVLLAHDAVVGASVVMAFTGIRTEVTTARLWLPVLRQHKRLALPRVVGDDIEAVEVHAPTELVPGARFGVPEPSPDRPALDPAVLDVVLVPGLAFDREGYRLGYGGGFYDRFLRRLRPGAVTIGLAFEEQLVERVPREAHDLPVTLVLFA